MVGTAPLDNNSARVRFQRASALAQLALDNCSSDFAMAPVPRGDELDASRSGSAWSSSVLLAPVHQQAHGLNPFQAVCVIVNYISIGYLFLPVSLNSQSNIHNNCHKQPMDSFPFFFQWVFVQAGTVLSVIGLFVVSSQSYITATYVLEACARAEALADWAERNKLQASVRNIVVVEDFSNHQPDETARSGDIVVVEAFSNHQPDETASSEEFDVDATYPPHEEAPRTETTPPYVIGHRRFEMPELNRIFLGDKLRYLFAFTTALDLYGITWSFAIVSAAALQENLPITDNPDEDYNIYMLVFAVIVVTLSCVPIIDQLVIQMLFLTFRLVMVTLMLLTVAVAFRADESHFFVESSTNSVPSFDVSNFYIMMQVGIFSTAYQFAVPLCSEISKDRTKMAPIFLVACGWIFLSTAVLSLTLAYFFGDSIETSSNLNWGGFHGGTGKFDEDGMLIGKAPWAKFISGFIVCFPAFDLLTVFPLVAISLGEILMGLWYSSDVHKIQDDWRRRTLFRVIASVPQIVGALFIKDIGAM